MKNHQPLCFFIMPFTGELHYFYLYLQHHIWQRFGIECIRADELIGEGPILEKIGELIRKADIIVADCSGSNPNVLLELGLALAWGKYVILITQDPMDRVPSDLKCFEFIKYNLSSHLDFLDKLDDGLRRGISKRSKYVRFSRAQGRRKSLHLGRLFGRL